MKGIQFLIDEQGNKTSVLIDLREWGALWEDIYDVMTAQSRRSEPVEDWSDLDQNSDEDDQPTSHRMTGDA